MLVSLIVLLIVLFDQATKLLVIRYLMPVHTIPIVQDALHLTYVENRGAAFGMLSNNRWVFMIISGLSIVLVAGYFLLRKRKGHFLLDLSLAFILAGGIGNMIDRIRLGYVVDFIDFRLINFAVFNVADSFISIGAVLLLVDLLFLEWDDRQKQRTSQRLTASETAGRDSCDAFAEDLQDHKESTADEQKGQKDQEGHP